MQFRLLISRVQIDQNMNGKHECFESHLVWHMKISEEPPDLLHAVLKVIHTHVFLGDEDV